MSGFGSKRNSVISSPLSSVPSASVERNPGGDDDDERRTSCLLDRLHRYSTANHDGTRDSTNSYVIEEPGDALPWFSASINGNAAGVYKTRQSLLYNEDDYDYAIELCPDDEYRQTVAALPKIVDFDELDLLLDEEDFDCDPAAAGTAAGVGSGSGDETAQMKTCAVTSVPFADVEAGLNPTRRRSSVHGDAVSPCVRRTSHFDSSMSVLHALRTSRDGADSDSPHHGVAPEDDLDDDDRSFTEPDECDDRNQHAFSGSSSSRSSRKPDRPSIASNASAKSAFSIISKKEFGFRLNVLEKQRKWVSRSARR